MTEDELRRALLRGVRCGKCYRPARIGPCPCTPEYQAPRVKVEDLDAAIRERLDDGRDGGAVRAVLDIHKPYFDEYRDGTKCADCTGHGLVNADYPCRTVLAVAKAMGIEAGS
jgi:hypothetical protein